MTDVRICPELSLFQSDLDSVASALRCHSAKLSGARILMTGATGFFGAWLTESLLHASRELGLGLRLDIVTRNPSGFAARMPHIASSPRAALIEADVRDFTLPGRDYDYIVHAAADSAAPHAWDRLAQAQTILLGTTRALDIARASGARGMLYVSSGAVYGRRAPLDRPRFDEDYPGGPLVGDRTVEYDESKRMGEALCAIAAADEGIPAKIARCFTFVGPYLPLDAHFAVGNFIRDALQGADIRVSGDGTAVRTYLYGADLARWLITILIDGTPGRPYNVGGDEPVTVGDLARLTADAAGGGTVRILGAAGQQQPSRIVPDVQRARSELGLTVEVELRDALHRTLAWHRLRGDIQRGAAAKELP